MSTRGGGGRGRGVGRGRSRGGGGMDTRRPGEGAQAAAPRGVRDQDGGQQQVGRGRGRAAAPIQPPQDQPPPTSTAPVQQMQQMSLGEPRGGGRRMERRQDDDIHTRPEHITNKKGSFGVQTPIMSNYLILRNRPGHAIYQYNVSYNPPVENKRMRLALLYHHEEALIGRVHSFDGMVLYLPHRLHNNPEEIISKTKEGDTIHITIKLTNELSANSPVCLQLFNILFRK